MPGTWELHPCCFYFLCPLAPYLGHGRGEQLRGWAAGSYVHAAAAAVLELGGGEGGAGPGAAPNRMGARAWGEKQCWQGCIWKLPSPGAVSHYLVPEQEQA